VCSSDLLPLRRPHFSDIIIEYWPVKERQPLRRAIPAKNQGLAITPSKRRFIS
jgi:hypothetical protein